jgi:ParB family chromosome partitioning protein
MSKEDRILQQIIGEDEKVKVEDIPLDQIRQNPYQPRRTFDAGSEKELAASIKEHGLLQPIVVRRLTDSSQHPYELVSGERRLRAFRSLGKNTIPAIVRAVNDTEMRTVALIENLQRENLNTYESIKSIYLLREELGSNELVAKALSKSVRTVERHIKIGKELVNFPEVDRIFADNAATLDLASAKAFADISANINRLRKSDKREYERIIKKFEKHGIKHTVEVLTKRFKTSPIPRVKKEPSFVFNETPDQVVLYCRWPKGDFMSHEQHEILQKNIERFMVAIFSDDISKKEAE